MHRKQKGTTLVEVLVSITVFAIISVAMFSSLLAMRKVVARQEEYLRFDMICRDIDFYYDEYGKDWAKEYFKEYFPEGMIEENTVYYYKNFQPMTDYADDAIYVLQYSYSNETGELIITVKTKSDQRIIIDSLKYGQSESLKSTKVN